MATVAWPNSLPDCAQTWREQDEPDMVQSEVDVGAPKVRRRSSILRRNIEVSWTLPASTYQQFMEFYETDCLQGVNDFPFAHPITKAVNTYRFTEAPTASFIGGGSNVAAVQVQCRWSLVS